MQKKMVLETPNLRVSRPVAACTRCRTAKTKCDGKLPACTACERAGKANECSNVNDEFAKGKERSYVATLEARIEKLEKKVEEARMRKRQGSVTMLMSPSPVEEFSTKNLGKPREMRIARRKEAVDIDDLVGSFGVLSVNAAARDFHGFTSSMSYARLILCAATKEPFPLSYCKPLPPRHESLTSAQHYLKNIYVLLPVFEETSFYTSLDAVYHPSGRVSCPTDHWTIHMVLAISAISHSLQRWDQPYNDAIGHVASALQYKDDVLKPGRLSSIQALLLLTQYARYDPCHLDSWQLVGAVSRAMVDLGYHQDPSKESTMPKGRLQSRRRIYHCVYALDRSTSIVLGRAFSFSDDSAIVAFPQLNPVSPTARPGGPDNRLWLQSTEQSYRLHQFRQIQSQWYQDVFESGNQPWETPYQYIWQKWHEMQDWYESLGNMSDLAWRVKIRAELELISSHVLLLAPSPKVPYVCELAQNLLFEDAMQYAVKMRECMDEPDSRHWLTYIDAIRAQRVALYFIQILRENWDRLLSGALPQASTAQTSGSAAPPPFSPNIRFDNVTRTINCIQQMNSILYRFGVRFGVTEWKERFDAQTKDLMAILV